MFRDRDSFRRIVTTTFVLALGAIATNEVIASPGLDDTKFTPLAKSLIIPEFDIFKDATSINRYDLSQEIKIETEEILEKMKNSQRSLFINYKFNAGGVDEKLTIKGGSTIIERENDFVFITAGHLFDYDKVGEIIGKYLLDKYKIYGIWTQDELVKSIVIDGIELPREKFGYYFEYEERGEDVKDIGYIVLNKNDLTANQLLQFKNGALKYEDISFKANDKDELNFGICYASADKNKPIITLNAKMLDKQKNFDIVGEFPIESGCSGDATFSLDRNGNLTFDGVIIQLPESEKYKGSAVINKLSSLGKETVDRGIMNAMSDVKSQKTNPHTR